jgi:cytidine deaminase
MNDKDLIAAAQTARSAAYAPYSKYTVGAALLTRSGRVFSGVNVENASYGLSICAERVAVFKAISEGERDFEAIAIVTQNGGMPCGACRQVLSEFSLDTRVLVADVTGAYQQWRVRDLLPASFGPASLTR